MSILSDDALHRLLSDDAPYGDLSTATLGIGAVTGRCEFRARQAMRLCGSEEAARLCELAGLQVSEPARSGTPLAADDLIFVATGTAAALHHAWKTAQVLIEWSSGIASRAARIVAAANGVTVACTRKSAPGTKALSVKAVRAGGARMHRLGLSETLLIFAEHRVFLSETPGETIARLRQQEPEKQIMVEVSDIATAVRWARAGADALQLEKFTPAAVAECRAALSANAANAAHSTRATRPPLLAAAGGVDADNAAAYVAAGAGLLVTSAPFYAPPCDVAVALCAC
ncbi:ModD protein [Rhodocyclus tenuis]|uniref:ModD protein n=1 Tax=Rhodocyclus gracilis TaxID=2929842 RepID=UPI001298B66F|nr:ModD protein [Rhodocyclus gracilis]MRD72380.1 ModD protein [Rhodocyclus gracilis]